MAAMNSSLHPVLPNRRRRVRHKIQTPAYATFTEQSQGAMLDLHEIVDISEDGIAMQCHAPLEVKTRVNLCLDLADCAEHIYTTGKVIWSNSSGRAGLRFSELSPDSLSRLREWLFVNVMAGVAHGETQLAHFCRGRTSASQLHRYAGGGHRRAAPGGGARSRSCRGAAVNRGARADSGSRFRRRHRSGRSGSDFMVCRASSGPDAPPVGARLQVGSGFSGECVKTGRLLRCDDTEIDSRVDRESCRALGIRSILAVPMRVGEKSIGILEVFSGQPNRFSDDDSACCSVLPRLCSPPSTAPHAPRICRQWSLRPSNPALRPRRAACSLPPSLNQRRKSKLRKRKSPAASACPVRT